MKSFKAGFLCVDTGDTGKVRQSPCSQKVPRLIEGGTWKQVGTFRCHRGKDRVYVGPVQLQRRGTHRVAHSQSSTLKGQKDSHELVKVNQG